MQTVLKNDSKFFDWPNIFRKASNLRIKLLLLFTFLAIMLLLQYRICFLGKPSVHVPTDRVIATVGDDLRVSCNASGIPRPIITWKRLLGDAPKDMSVSSDGTLFLKSVSKAESGIYQCTAKNKIDSSSKSIVLVVMEGKLQSVV